jgi:nicotinamidase/pyrazinamidase
MPPRKIILWEVDVQADFMLPGGRLYVPGAEKIIPNIRRLMAAASESGALIISSGDSHPEGDPEFETFPPHCLRGTPGAQIIPEGLTKNFSTIPNDASRDMPGNILSFPQVIFEKQTLDVFNNPHAGKIVERLGYETQYIVFGVVTEYCVRLAVKGLLERGRNVAVVTDAIEALNPEAGQRTLVELQALGARLITTDQAIEEISVSSHQSDVRVSGVR